MQIAFYENTQVTEVLASGHHFKQLTADRAKEAFLKSLRKADYEKTVQ